MPYADVNGLHLYYQEHGEGPPLVLLHGGLMTIELNFGIALPVLAERHRVIAVELQGHGRTGDVDRRPNRAHSTPSLRRQSNWCTRSWAGPTTSYEASTCRC